MNLKGLTSKQAEESRKKHGANTLTEIPADPLWKKILEGFKDPMIMILMVAFVVQLVLCFIGEAEWFEPVGVLIAILIANGVSSISESKQEGKASALKAEELAKETAKVIRDGKLIELHVSDVVVGDIVFLQAGDKIPADGAVCDGAINVDQAALNGETEEAEKTVGDDNYDINDLLNKRYVYRGTVVCSGEAYVEIKVVGDNTLFGKLALEVQEDTRETPLQVKLGKLAKQISTFGYIGAICIVVGVLLKSVISGELPDTAIGWLRLIMDAVTVAVTVIVCAVPEGLPMLTSILLSFQSLRMAKDNVLVRKINGLETAGSLSILFSDKTGTITEGRLSVVELALGNVTVLDKLSKAPKSMIDDVIVGIGVNNSSTASNGSVIGGNSTDRAMMGFLVDSGVSDLISKDNVKNFSPFDSNKKSSSVTVSLDGKDVTYIKGAAERIIERCTHYIDENGNVKDFNTKDKLTEYSDAQAGRSMRLLAVAKVDGSDDSGNNLTLVCVLSIRDNVRKEAADAIKEVQNAGIQVVMVTGDRKETAAAIAKEAGLLTSPEHVVLTSPELAAMSDDEVKKILPNLRVVARALPMDKSRLVRLAQELNYVVGMTGDGVNDSPALKKADVGFAMGSGTEVAKDAGDITIMDDNFSSIEKAILYGRTMFKSIRKFLIFQLTVNVAAVLTCFIAPLLGENVVLTVVQLLLINLAMDTLAAIAFGSEPALKEYMKEKPIPRSASIISKGMLVEIIISALYITLICLGILFIPFIRDLFGDVDRTYLKSALFATFMMAITFNGFNARTSHINIFKEIGRNKSFLIVMASIFILQFVFVTFGGEFLSVEALSLKGWLICIVLAVLVIPIDMIRKAIMNKKQ